MAAFYHTIDPYYIKIEDRVLTVLPLEDGVYRVQQDEMPVADLYPEITAAGVYWNGFGQISAGLADEIGSQIYAWEI
ncbi:hypothetical protein ACXZ1K_03365 [Pedobacter sp. PWIIR3]